MNHSNGGGGNLSVVVVVILETSETTVTRTAASKVCKGQYRGGRNGSSRLHLAGRIQHSPQRRERISVTSEKNICYISRLDAS